MRLKRWVQGVLLMSVLTGCNAMTPTSQLTPLHQASVPLTSLSASHRQPTSQAQQRFERSSMGVITDHQTGLQWLEGPDVPTSWNMANEWVNTLGQGWRLPTTQELSGLYLKDSKRRGKYNDPLGLDEVFVRESGYSFWSVKRSSNSAWMYDFSRGYYHWTEVGVRGHFDRAVAVRKKQQQLELPFG